ncbi:hypothetical protein D3C81_1500510 [compost metagenome]
MRFATSAITPMAAMATKAARQPSCWPRNVPSGTPVTVATVKPVNIIEIALALRFSGTRSAAIVEAIDMNRPCDRAEITRAISSRVMPSAAAARLLPMMNSTISDSSRVLRDTAVVSEVSTGAPKVTPRAYNVTVRPAAVTDICRSSAMSGSRPTLINSVVPIAKALTARASSARVLLL